MTREEVHQPAAGRRGPRAERPRRPPAAKLGAPGRSLSRPERRIVAYEREAEQLAITQALDAAVDQRGRLLVVEGPGGSGRSLLLDLASYAAASKGFDVLRATGRPTETSSSYGVARQLLEARVQQSTTIERTRLFAASAAVTAPLFGIRSPEPVVEGAERLHRTAHGLAWLIHNISRAAPTLVVVDDADLADDDSMRALSRLNQRLADFPIVVMLAMRDTNHLAPTRPAEELRVHEAARVLRLAPLSLAGISRLARRRFFPGIADETCRDLAHWTGGLPALVTDVLAELEARGAVPGDAAFRVDRTVPDSVVAGVAERLRRLTPDAGPLARALAVLGPGTPLDQAGVLARLDGSRPSLALDALVRDGLVVAEGGGTRFAAPLLAAAVADTAPAADRSRLHLQAARLLRGRGADDDDIAAHLLRADASGDRWSVAVLERAAIGALARSEPDVALRYLQRAMAEPPPPDRQGPIMVTLGQAEVVAGMPTAADRFRAAAALLEDPARRAGVFDDLGRRLLLDGAVEDAAVAFGEGLGAADDPASEEALRLRAGLLRAVHLEPSLRERWKRYLVLPPTPDGSEGHQHTAAGRALVALVYLDRLYHGAAAGVVRDLCLRLVDAIDAGGTREREAATRCDIGLALLLCGDAANAEGVLGDALDDARSPGLRLSAGTRRVIARLLLGALPGAEADAEATVRDAASVAAVAGATPATVTAGALLALAHLERGRVRRAAAALAAADHERVEGTVAAWELAAGWLALATGEADDAATHFRAAASAEHPLPVLGWEAGAALAARAAGRADEAVELGTRLLRRVRTGPSPVALAEARRVLGTVTPGPDGLALLRYVADGPGEAAPLEKAKALVALGTVLVRGNHREAGVARLRAGLERARACGADGLVEAALAALAPPGSRPALRSAALTRSEEVVAGLAAAGRANREIADELGVSVRLVEWYLRNAYRKLGITSRRQLPADLVAEEHAGADQD